VAQEEHVTQLDGSAAIVLGELILVELGEGRRQSLLHLAGERHAPVLPVDCDKLCELVGALDNGGKRICHQMTMCLVARHLADQQQGRVTQLHPRARFDGQRRHLLTRDLGYQFSNATGDLDSVLIELRLPEQTRQHRAPQLQFRRDVPRRRAFVGSGADLRCIQSGHDLLLQ
jgi:hypothetical protein